MHGSGGSHEAETNRMMGSHVSLPFHPEGHFGSFSLLKRRVVGGGGGEGGGWGSGLFPLERKAIPPLATGSKVLQAMPTIPTFSLPTPHEHT